MFLSFALVNTLYLKCNSEELKNKEKYSTMKMIIMAFRVFALLGSSRTNPTIETISLKTTIQIPDSNHVQSLIGLSAGPGLSTRITTALRRISCWSCISISCIRDVSVILAGAAREGSAR